MFGNVMKIPLTLLLVMSYQTVPEPGQDKSLPASNHNIRPSDSIGYWGVDPIIEVDWYDNVSHSLNGLLSGSVGDEFCKVAYKSPEPNTDELFQLDVEVLYQTYDCVPE